MNLKTLAQSNILDTLNFSHASEEERQEALDEATDVIMAVALERIEEEIPEKAQGEFDRVFEEGTEEDRVAFLKKYVPNLDEIFIGETLRYKLLAEIITESEKAPQER